MLFIITMHNIENDNKICKLTSEKSLFFFFFLLCTLNENGVMIHFAVTPARETHLK